MQPRSASVSSCCFVPYPNCTNHNTVPSANVVAISRRNHTMAQQSQLNARSAVTFGLVCVAVSVPPILGGLGVIDMKLTPGTPRWVGVGAGCAFLLAGITL